MNRASMIVTAVFMTALFGSTAAYASEQVTRVAPSTVCMINNASMAAPQIPVKVAGKTYYGCCPMCKERLEKDSTSRMAIDPVSGKPVDKASAVIGALPGAKVLYFKNEKNLLAYNAGTRHKSAK